MRKNELYNGIGTGFFNIENGPFIYDFPIKTSIYKGFSMAMLNNQMVYHQLVTGGVVSSR